MNLSFDQLITFSRTSAATYVNSAGNVVRTPASKNLLLWTEDFDNAAWSKTAATVTGNNAVGPDGRNTADTLTASAGTGLQPRLQQIVATVNASVYTASAFVQPGTHTFLQVQVAGTNDFCNFTLTGSGSVQNNGGAVGAITFNSATGWYRVSVTYTANSTDRHPVFFIPQNAAATALQAWNPAGTETILIWGAQLELGSAATSYVKNDGGLFPARFDYDPATLAPKGLLIESQRTNLLLWSEEFDNASWGKNAPVSITANYAVSPDGTADADRFVSTGGAFPQVGQSVALTAGQPYTFSVWVKSDGTSQIQQTLLLDGSQTNFTPTATWTRVSVTVASSTGGSKSVVIATNAPSAAASSFLVWGAQVELGSYATSYIPTAGSQVTRTADIAAIVAPNFAPWYNQSEGTFVVEADSVTPTDLNVFHTLSISDGTSNNLLRIFRYSHRWGASGMTGGTSQFDTQVNGSYTPNVVGKIAFAYKANDVAVSVGGSAVVTDSSVSLPTVDRMFLGASGSGGFNFLEGHIRSIRYFPTRLSNAQLQALSA